MTDTTPTIHCATETPNAFPVKLEVRTHTFRSDGARTPGAKTRLPDLTTTSTAPSAACKALTATWYARKHQMPWSVWRRGERNDAEERRGKYVLKVHLAFHGPLSADQRSRLYNAVAACPVHKLMTTTDVVIETAPLEGAGSP